MEYNYPTLSDMTADEKSYIEENADHPLVMSVNDANRLIAAIHAMASEELQNSDIKRFMRKTPLSIHLQRGPIETPSITLDAALWFGRKRLMERHTVVIGFEPYINATLFIDDGKLTVTDFLLIIDLQNPGKEKTLELLQKGVLGDIHHE